MKKKYAGITIGPILDTLKQARKTRELWSVSFTFSILMKCLIKEMQQFGKLISPGLNVKQPLHGAGVFPDRSYFEFFGPDLSEKQILCLKKHVFTEFEKLTGIRNGENYYQVYIAQIETDKVPVATLNRVLDAMELQQRYNSSVLLDWKNIWASTDKSISKNYFQQLYTMGYSTIDVLPSLLINNTEQTRRFMSVPEISTNELAKKNPELYWGTLGYQGLKTSTNTLYFSNLAGKELDEEDAIIEAIRKAFPDDFLFRHKYFSIIYADGDSVGRLVEEIDKNNPDELQDFSNRLNKFVEEATELLVRYGAFPVYAGGDDMLFFAPLATDVVNDNLSYAPADPTHGNIFGNNLFFLLSAVNRIFQNKMAPVICLNKSYPAVSLSFGVMVGYYKHPLSEVLDEAYSLLTKRAKKQKDKNHIAMKVVKHSGSWFEFGFKQEGPLYECFLRLTTESRHKEPAFLNSVMYKLDDQKLIIDSIGNDDQRLHIFFSENFNEPLHDNYKAFFEALVNLISLTFSMYKNEDLESRMGRIYGALRFVHFLNAKDSND